MRSAFPGSAILRQRGPIPGESDGRPSLPLCSLPCTPRTLLEPPLNLWRAGWGPDRVMEFSKQKDSLPTSNLTSENKFLKRFYLFIFRERGREGEREGEKHQCVVASHVPPTGDLAHNPGVCPDWELNCDPLVRRPALSPLSHTSQVHVFE